MTSGRFGLLEEAAGLVEAAEELAVGVGLGVAVGLVEAEGDGAADRVALAVLAAAGT